MATSSASRSITSASSRIGGKPKRTSTGAPAACARSAAMRTRTDSASSKRVALNEFRYSLSDLDSTNCGESAGTVNVATCTTGLPRIQPRQLVCVPAILADEGQRRIGGHRERGAADRAADGEQQAGVVMARILDGAAEREFVRG